MNKKRDHKKAIQRRKFRNINSKTNPTKTKIENIDIKNMFDSIIGHEIDKIDVIMNKIKNSNETNIFVKYWWKSFYINSKMLEVLLHQKHSYYQFASTIRLLLEISVDLLFISNNQGNINNFTKQQNKIIKKQDHNPNYSHRNAARDCRNFQLRLDSDQKSILSINQRIKLRDESTLPDLYSELSSASHFNHMQIIWEINKSTDNEYFLNFIYLLQFYPSFLKDTLKAIGDLIDSNKLSTYSTAKMSEKLKILQERLSESNILIEYDDYRQNNPIV